VTSGDQTLRAAVDEALRDWVSDPNGTYYCLGSAIGPHPYPYIVRELQSVIGREAREQFLAARGKLPDLVAACVGGGSNAIGLFHAFLNDRDVAIWGAEAAGEGIASGRHAASLAAGRPGVLHGNRTYVLCDDNGQITETHSVSAGLDYPGVGPEHAFLKDSGRAKYVGITDDEALEAFHELARTEGILAALESSHAVAQAMKLAREMDKKQLILVNLSGRGDKDVHTIAAREGLAL
jgi:tryptophan synthase beta chain